MAGSCVLAGCGSSGESKPQESTASAASQTQDGKTTADPAEGLTPAASTDKYRNVYQIFTQSFCDSNDDNIGDFQGIISQLDYINDGDPAKGDDLGADALWMTPIMPSDSYHKYNVEDYYNVDKDFGTLEDFDKLVEECHKRGISVILDLVLNHISYKNPLFLDACEEVKQGKLDGKAQYFEFHEEGYYGGDVQTIKVGDYVCEANFSDTMPEWNLSSEKTKEEFSKIAKFWLDRGVDGFRLDAVKYFNNKHTDGVEFLKWFVDTCRGIKSDVYL
ncbi:MAG: alpha-amylase family glycosyl hydrolase, partial [Bacteroidaceae bacterium]|nr:alpha-amylase family glycosyl hydrolase [Bacteroidaceae bacterium]